MSVVEPSGAGVKVADPPAELLNDEMVQTILELSASIYDDTAEIIKNSTGSSAALLQEQGLRSVEYTKKIRKRALKLNKLFVRLVKSLRYREDRLVLEAHLLRAAARRDKVDRDANRARVYDQLRRSTVIGGTEPAINSTNPLYAASASSVAVDKAIASVTRVQFAISDLSPLSLQLLHGAPLLLREGGEKNAA